MEILKFNSFIMNEGWKENLLSFLLVLGGENNGLYAQHLKNDTGIVINQNKEDILNSVEFKELSNELIDYMNKYKNELKEHELDYLYYKNHEDKNLFWFGKAGYNITEENISNEFKNSNSYFNQKLINFNNIYQNVKYEYDSLVSLDDINIEQYSKLIFISYELKYLNKLLN